MNEYEYVDLPARAPIEPVTAPVDLVLVEDIQRREGLWTVVYKDDGTMGISDWPIPADRPDGLP